jgi:hypothetical protein
MAGGDHPTQQSATTATKIHADGGDHQWHMIL